MLIDVERELLLKEIDKSKGELKIKLEDVNKSITEEAEVGKKFERQLIVEKEQRGKEIQKIDKRIEDIMGLMQEAVNQSSEAVKAVCRALVTREAAERNQSQESIMKNLQARMGALEDLLKFYTSKSSEELRIEIKELLENEKHQRAQMEAVLHKKMKEVENLLTTNKENLEIELCVRSLVDNTINEDTRHKMIEQKIELESITKKWVNNFEKDLEDTTASFEKEISGLNEKIETINSNMQNRIETKVEIRAVVDSMISLIEKHDTNEGIKESHNNVEVLFRNMKKLEEFVHTTREQIEKNEEAELSSVKNTIVKEIEKLDQREAENNDINKEKIEFIIEKIEDMEKADHQKAINILMDQLGSMKQDLFIKQEAIDELTTRQGELVLQNEQLIKSQSQQSTDLQGNLKLLVESNVKLEDSINAVQQELPSILQKINDHDEKLKQLIE